MMTEVVLFISILLHNGLSSAAARTTHSSPSAVVFCSALLFIYVYPPITHLCFYQTNTQRNKITLTYLMEAPNIWKTLSNNTPELHYINLSVGISHFNAFACLRHQNYLKMLL
jgi:hypothetical protein